MGSKRIIALIGGIVVLALLLAASSVVADAPAQEDEGEIGEAGTSALWCGDSVNCSRSNWVLRVINSGGGHGIWAKSVTSTGWKAAVYGEATNKGCGLRGKSNEGDGVRGESTDGIGGWFTSANNFGAYVKNAGRDGVYVYHADDDGVQVNNAADIGVYVYHADGDGFYIEEAGWRGVYVYQAAGNGVSVYEAGEHGVTVGSAAEDGMVVWNAGRYGGRFNGDTCGVVARSTSGNLIEAVALDPYNRRFYVDNDGEVYADGNFHSGGADFAEMLPAVEELEPADVLIVNQDGELDRSSKPYATSVVGVYSTKPGFLGGFDEDDDMTSKVPLAVVGVVPVKASAENGAIQPGDLLATSSIPGHAMKATEPKLGTLIGKALGSLESDTGTIQMLVTLQ